MRRGAALAGLWLRRTPEGGSQRSRLACCIMVRALRPLCDTGGRGRRGRRARPRGAGAGAGSKVPGAQGEGGGSQGGGAGSPADRRQRQRGRWAAEMEARGQQPSHGQGPARQLGADRALFHARRSLHYSPIRARLHLAVLCALTFLPVAAQPTHRSCAAVPLPPCRPAAATAPPPPQLPRQRSRSLPALQWRWLRWRQRWCPRWWRPRPPPLRGRSSSSSMSRPGPPARPAAARRAERRRAASGSEPAGR